MPNIGKTLEEKLKEIGISSPDDLNKTGSKDAFIRLKIQDPTACFNMLCALEGAIQGMRWHSLASEIKRELKEFYRSIQ